MLIEMPLSFVAEGPMDDDFTLIQVMDWRLCGAKSLPEPIMDKLFDFMMSHLVTVSHCNI